MKSDHEEDVRFAEILDSVRRKVEAIPKGRRPDLSAPTKHRIQLIGKRTVDWYPMTTKRRAKIAGVPDPRLAASADEVLAWSLGRPIRGVEKQMECPADEQRGGAYD